MSRIHIPDDVNEFPVSYAFRTYAREIGEAALNFSGTVYDHTLLSLREMEGARVRTAYINGCAICKKGRAARDFDTDFAPTGTAFSRPMSSRGAIPDEAFYAAIPHWRESALFSQRERLAIEFAERMGERPHSLEGDEAFWHRIHAHFSDREIVDLTLSIASWIAMGRVVHTLELDAVCALPHELPGAHMAVAPPSATNSAPVQKLASSDAR
jgi:alkylhydroperoxidase family enzyme